MHALSTRPLYAYWSLAAALAVNTWMGDCLAVQGLSCRPVSGYNQYFLRPWPVHLNFNCRPKNLWGISTLRLQWSLVCYPTFYTAVRFSVKVKAISYSRIQWLTGISGVGDHWIKNEIWMDFHSKKYVNAPLGGGQNFERANVERPIFRILKIASVKDYERSSYSIFSFF